MQYNGGIFSRNDQSTSLGFPRKMTFTIQRRDVLLRKQSSQHPGHVKAGCGGY
jgi:hypothetical protein